MLLYVKTVHERLSFPIQGLVCVCVCVCVREREREREGTSGAGMGGGSLGGGSRGMSLICLTNTHWVWSLLCSNFSETTPLSLNIPTASAYTEPVLMKVEDV